MTPSRNPLHSKIDGAHKDRGEECRLRTLLSDDVHQ